MKNPILEVKSSMENSNESPKFEDQEIKKLKGYILDLELGQEKPKD